MDIKKKCISLTKYICLCLPYLKEVGLKLNEQLIINKDGSLTFNAAAIKKIKTSRQTNHHKLVT